METDMLVVYESRDEVLITTPDNEKNFIEMYFNDSSRNIDDYDRSVYVNNGVVQINMSQEEEVLVIDKRI